MPELPEVEIVRRRLDPRVVGRTIVAVAVADAAVSGLSEAELTRRLVGRRVVRTGRRGKWLLLEVGAPQSAGAAPVGAPSSIETYMVVHLRMTGRLLFEPDPGAAAPPRFTVRFDDGSRLLFYDVRRFGGLWAVPADEIEEFFAGLGVEPLGDELTVERLRSLMSGRRAPLKSFLLDQRHVAGSATSTPTRRCSAPGCTRCVRRARSARAKRRGCTARSAPRCSWGSITRGPVWRASSTPPEGAGTSRRSSTSTSAPVGRAEPAARRSGAWSSAVAAPTIARAASRGGA
jgi:hypothetical protein